MRTKPVIGNIYWIVWEHGGLPDIGEAIEYASDRRVRMKELTSHNTLNIFYGQIHERLPYKLSPYLMQNVIKNLFDNKARFK
jgi:hypothetical protein